MYVPDHISEQSPATLISHSSLPPAPSQSDIQEKQHQQTKKRHTHSKECPMFREEVPENPNPTLTADAISFRSPYFFHYHDVY